MIYKDMFEIQDFQKNIVQPSENLFQPTQQFNYYKTKTIEGQKEIFRKKLSPKRIFIKLSSSLNSSFHHTTKPIHSLLLS